MVHKERTLTSRSINTGTHNTAKHLAGIFNKPYHIEKSMDFVNKVKHLNIK